MAPKQHGAPLPVAACFLLLGGPPVDGLRASRGRQNQGTVPACRAPYLRRQVGEMASLVWSWSWSADSDENWYEAERILREQYPFSCQDIQETAYNLYTCGWSEDATRNWFKAIDILQEPHHCPTVEAIQERAEELEEQRWSTNRREVLSEARQRLKKECPPPGPIRMPDQCTTTTTTLISAAIDTQGDGRPGIRVAPDPDYVDKSEIDASGDGRSGVRVAPDPDYVDKSEIDASGDGRSGVRFAPDPDHVDKNEIDASGDSLPDVAVASPTGDWLPDVTPDVLVPSNPDDSVKNRIYEPGVALKAEESQTKRAMPYYRYYSAQDEA